MKTNKTRLRFLGPTVFIFIQLIQALPCKADFASPSFLNLFSDNKTTVHGIVFTRLSDGKVLFEKNADNQVSPASITKILTSAAALALYGPSYSIKTPLYANGKLEGGRLKGSLYIKGMGDPFLVSEVLWQTVVDLKHLGIRSIDGDLVADISLFDKETRDESRQDGAKKSTHAYDAPVSAFAVNFNTIAIAVAPAQTSRQPALLGLSPFNLPSAKLSGRVDTVNGASDAVAASRNTLANGGVSLQASGQIGVDAPIKKIYRSVGDPLLTSLDYFRGFLETAGIKVKGKNLVAETPASARKIYDIQGYDMRRIASGLNTFSNNFIADMLTKKIASSFSNPQLPDANGSGRLDQGVAVISQFLRSNVGVTGEFRLFNGSGLSTENRLTARQIMQVLTWMEKQGDLFPDFLGGLPASGLDGTLKKRMSKSDELLGLVRAKTGTLTEPITVAGMAGYYRHPKEGWIGFVMIANGREGQGQPGLLQLRKQQDDAIKLSL